MISARANIQTGARITCGVLMTATVESDAFLTGTFVALNIPKFQAVLSPGRPVLAFFEAKPRVGLDCRGFTRVIHFSPACMSHAELKSSVTMIDRQIPAHGDFFCNGWPHQPRQFKATQIFRGKSARYAPSNRSQPSLEGWFHS
jgi:hypothetical protein